MAIRLFAAFLFVHLLYGQASPEPEHRTPTRPEVALWLGSFQFGPETISFSWEEGLVLTADRIRVPVDGTWHDTVPTFSVRHRASWDGTLVRFEEQHNQGSHWHYFYELAEDGQKLTKSVISGGSRQIVRTYSRQPQ